MPQPNLTVPKIKPLPGQMDLPFKDGELTTETSSAADGVEVNIIAAKLEKVKRCSH
jgi:hypothetical protein